MGKEECEEADLGMISRDRKIKRRLHAEEVEDEVSSSDQADAAAEVVASDYPQIIHVEGIVCNILSWLPPLSLARARCVCKQWNKIVLTQKSRTRMISCLFSCPLKKAKLNKGGGWQWEKDTIHDGRAFDPYTSTWKRIPLPKSFFNSCMSLFPKAVNIGLVALRDRVPFKPLVHFWVGNPMTNKWKRISGTSDPDQGPGFDSTYELIVDEESKSYKIIHFFCSRTRPLLRTQIYDSLTEQWTLGSTFPREGPFYIGSSAVHNGAIYFLQERPIPDSQPYQMSLCIVRYDVRQDLFTVIVSAGPYTIHDVVPFRLIFNSDDKSELQVPSIVARICEGDRYEVRRIGLLKFSSAAHRWVWDETWQVNVSEWFSDKCGVGTTTMTGDAGFMYTISKHSSNKVMLCNADRSVCGVLPDPYDTSLYDVHEMKGAWSSATMCTFIPRYDVEP